MPVIFHSMSNNMPTFIAKTDLYPRCVFIITQFEQFFIARETFLHVFCVHAMARGKIEGQDREWRGYVDALPIISLANIFPANFTTTTFKNIGTFLFCFARVSFFEKKNIMQVCKLLSKMTSSNRIPLSEIDISC